MDLFMQHVYLILHVTKIETYLLIYIYVTPFLQNALNMCHFNMCDCYSNAWLGVNYVTNVYLEMSQVLRNWGTPTM